MGSARFGGDGGVVLFQVGLSSITALSGCNPYSTAICDLCPHRYDNRAALDRRRGAEHGPCLHQLAPLLKQITARVSARCLAARDMRQRALTHLVWERCALAAPVPERAAHAVRRHV